MTTRLNVNIRTLLSNCEDLAKDEVNFWRLKKFIKSLDTMIEELRQEETDTATTKIPEYERRLKALKDCTNYIDNSSTVNSRQSKGMDNAEDAISEVKQLRASMQYTDLRKELLNEDSVRRRRPDEMGAGADLNEAMKYYNQAQEKITEHMLSLTRSLKEQTQTANRIIKKDTQIVSKSTDMTDNNINSLHKETEKLENHSRNAYKCWMWMMIVFVIVIFIGMVLFMKIMKKKKV